MKNNSIYTKKDNLILDKSFNFSLKIIELFKKLENNREYIISKQIMRSGTSIGANLVESNSGESKKDFIHKMMISLKEANETLYWLMLLEKGNLFTEDLGIYFKEINEIIAILTKIIKTSKQNM